MSQLSVGVDVGGTKTLIGVVDAYSGAVHSFVRIPTEVTEGGAAFADRLVEQLQGLRQKFSTGFLGLAIPELITLEHQVASQYLWDWEALNLTARLGSVVFESDVVAAARAEARFGPYAGQTFLYVSVGTGLSSCLVVNGQVYRGSRGFAIHCGHTPLRVPGWPTGLVLEEMVSGSGLLHSVQRVAPGLCLSTEQVFERHRQGHPQVQTVVRQAAALLGSWLGQMVNTLDPQAVVLGGGLAAVEAYFREVEVNLRAAVWSPLVRDLPVVTACFGPMNGMVGAALPIDP